MILVALGAINPPFTVRANDAAASSAPVEIASDSADDIVEKCSTEIVRITLASEQINLCAPSSSPFDVVEDSLSDPGVAYAQLSQTDGYGVLNVRSVAPGSSPGIDRPAYTAGRIDEYRQEIHKLASSLAGARLSDGPAATLWGNTTPGMQTDVTLSTSAGDLAVRSVEWFVEHGGRLWVFLMAWDTGMSDAKQWSAAANGFSTLANDGFHLVDSAFDLGAAFQEAMRNPTLATGTPTDVDPPSWWEGECNDVNFYEDMGVHSYPLGASWHGVVACGPRYKTHLVQFFPGAWGEYEFQCVELVMRFLYQEWGIPPWSGNANKIKDTFTSDSLAFYPNGTNAIVPGDIITEDASTSNPYGHTAIVTGVDLDANGTGTITIMEENASAGGSRSLKVENWTVERDAYAFSQEIQGWLHVGPNNPVVGSIAAGKLYTCWLDDEGVAACWGDHTYSQTTAPDEILTQISTGYLHACGLKTDGTVVCWGSNASKRATPPSGTFTQVSAGYAHTCGIKSGGTLACWGNDDYAQASPPSGVFTQVSAGYRHTCGLKSNGKIACWGDDAYGQVTWPSGTFTQVSAGHVHTCGVKTDGTVACWGSNASGRSTPPSGTFTQVSAGYAHTCGVKSDGTLACWGNNTYGQSTPPSGTFAQVSAGYRHTCVLKSDGSFICWGDNASGQSAPFSISGNTGLGEATLSYVDGSAKTVTSASDGSYTFAVSYNWSGAVTPSLEGYAFSPSQRDFANLRADQTDQDFALSVVVSGNTGVNGVALSYVDTVAKTVVSGSNGSYSITLPYGWSGEIKPTKSKTTFTPSSRSYSGVTTHQDSQDYAIKASATFYSTSSQDGYISESSEASNTGGSLDSTSTTFRLGDTASNRQYRAILSFNTASLPDNATIKSAVLKIKQSGSPVGSDPFGVLGLLRTDLRKGYFGGSSTLQLTDFNASATATKVGNFAAIPADGWYSATLSSTGRSNINKTSVTQFRLYFSLDDNNDKLSNYMKFFSGETSGSKPKLILTYTVP